MFKVGGRNYLDTMCSKREITIKVYDVASQSYAFTVASRMYHLVKCVCRMGRGQGETGV